MKKEPLKTREVIERLAEKFPSPQYGFITQVRSGTGAFAERTADAMAMSLWPSRGLHLYGFEVKVSRTDWVKELNHPAKAECLASYCHFWYVAVGDETIIKTGELPPTWGLITPYGKGLKVLKEAPMNQNILPLDYVLLGGIFRNIAERCTANEVIQSRLDAQYQRGLDWAKSDYKTQTEKVRNLEDCIDTFQKISGVKIDTWNPDNNRDIGKAVSDVLNGRDKQAKERMVRLLEKARNIVKYIEGQEISSYDC